MIKTIEIAPDIIAKELAQYLFDNQYLYTEHDQACIHIDELAYLIKEFLNR